MAFSLLNPIEQEILSVIKKNVDLLTGVKSESEFLRLKLGYHVASIHDQLIKWREDSVQQTARNHMVVMRALVHDMEDCLERFLYRVRLKEKTGTLDGLIPQSLYMGKKILGIRELAKMMKKLHKQLEEVNKLVELLPANAAPQQAEPETEPVTENPVGFYRATEKLFGLLNMTGREPRKLRVIAIVGFAGSGKTTLAYQVYKKTSPDGVGVFPLRTWIDRADYKDATELLRKIIQKFWGTAADNETQEFNVRDLHDYIKDKLAGQRYLIVLDDMNDNDHWSWVKNTFDAESENGSRIIVTTRLLSISKHCRGHGRNSYIYQMRAIGDNACKQISSLDVDDDDHQHSENSSRKKHSKKLLKKCGGHPLALCSVNNHLTSIGGTRREKCEALCKNLGKFLHDAQEDHTRDFRRLRSVLMDNLVGLDLSTDRSRLLYLGIFPIGCPIKRSKLTRRWDAEGYQEGKGIDKFIEQNIIQPTGIRNSGKKWKMCETLSILQEFALHKSISDNFIMAIDDGPPNDLSSSTGNNENRKVRHISVNVSGVQTSGTVDLSCVRSLTISKKADLGGAFSKFSQYDLLRVLDMEDCCQDVKDTQLKDICNLWNLRYLSLGNNVTKLPGQFVEKLQHLESIHLSKEEVSELPVQVIWMPHLKHLIGKIKFMYHKDKDALVQSQNSNLKTIAGVVASAEDKGFLVNMMPNMGKLEKVKIWCTSQGNIQALDTHLAQAILLYSNSNCDMQRCLTIDFKGLTQNDMEILQSRRPYNDRKPKKLFQEAYNFQYLSTLKLHGLLSKLPRFLDLVSDLSRLCLSLTTLEQGHLSRLSEVLPLIVHLKLIAGHVDRNHLEIPAQGFQNLESLCFEVTGSSAPEVKISIIENTVLESGETVSALPKLVSFQLLSEKPPDPSGIQIKHIRNLEEIELHHKFKGDARILWEEAAWDHPNRPTVLPLQSFDDPDSIATEELLLESPLMIVNEPGEIPEPEDRTATAESGDNEKKSIITISSTLVKKAASKFLKIFTEGARHSSGRIPSEN